MKNATNNEIAKRILAVLIAIIMIWAIIPLIAFGDEDNGYNTSQQLQTIQLSYDIELVYQGVSGNPNTSIVNWQGGLFPGEVVTNKYVTPRMDGYFDITLEAIGRAFDREVENRVPIVYDVVFVLDYSGSMGSGAGSKLANMQDAAFESMRQILRNNTYHLYNRVAIVGYGDIARWRPNTLALNSQSWLNTAPTSEAWYTAIPNNSTASTLLRTPFTSSQFTNIMSGMNMAQQILSKRQGAEAERNSIVVLMTDGQPNRYYLSFGQFTNTGAANRMNSAVGANGLYADQNAVFHTIMNMRAVKNSIPGLQLFTIGFDLDNVSSNGINFSTSNNAIATGPANATNLQIGHMQRAFAFATINPSTGPDGNLTRSGSSVSLSTGTGSAAGAQNSNNHAFVTYQLSELTTRLNTASGGVFINPVDVYQNAAGASLDNIVNAFMTIIETINNNDPINGSIQLHDVIDAQFEIVPGSFMMTNDAGTLLPVGGMPNAVTIANPLTMNGLLTWELNNLRTLSPTNSADVDGRTPFANTTPSTLRFTVRPTDITMNNRALADGQIRLYTNTNHYASIGDANLNRATFRPLSTNPFYFAQSQAPDTPTGGNHLVSAGVVTQRFLTTGYITLDALYQLASIDVPIFKNVQAAREGYNIVVPANQTFYFYLYLQTGTVPVATASITITDNNQIGKAVFDWGNNTFSYLMADVLPGNGLFMFLYERRPIDASGTWSSHLGDDVFTDRIHFGTLWYDGAFTFTQNGNVVTNKFDQSPQCIMIPLHKYFSGDADLFRHHLSSPSALRIDYTFTFELLNDREEIVDYQVLTIPSAEIADIISMILATPINLAFNIPAHMIGNGQFTLREFFGYGPFPGESSEYWILSAPRSVVVPLLGSANGYEADAQIMVNYYRNVITPIFYFDKRIVDARSVSETNPAGDTSLLADGVFSFDLSRSAAFTDADIIQTVQLATTHGTGRSFVRLVGECFENFCGHVYLREIGIDGHGMVHDRTKYAVHFNYGVFSHFTIINSDDNRLTDRILFVNLFTEPLTPQILIQKNIVRTGVPEHEDFIFDVFLNDDDNPFITIELSGASVQLVTLPINFNGDVTVIERTDGFEPGWTFAEPQTLRFINGVYDGEDLIPTALFINEFMRQITPVITIQKEVRGAAAFPVEDFTFVFDVVTSMSDPEFYIECIPITGEDIYTVILPTNFTGIIYVWEYSYEISGWTFDDNVWVFVFENGELLGDMNNAIAVFINTFEIIPVIPRINVSVEKQVCDARLNLWVDAVEITSAYLDDIYYKIVVTIDNPHDHWPVRVQIEDNMFDLRMLDVVDLGGWIVFENANPLILEYSISFEDFNLGDHVNTVIITDIEFDGDYETNFDPENPPSDTATVRIVDEDSPVIPPPNDGGDDPIIPPPNDGGGDPVPDDDASPPSIMTPPTMVPPVSDVPSAEDAADAELNDAEVPLTDYHAAWDPPAWPDAFVDIVDDDVPLDDYDDLLEMDDADVPLSEMPRTGVRSHKMIITVSGFFASALAALITLFSVLKIKHKMQQTN